MSALCLRRSLASAVLLSSLAGFGMVGLVGCQSDADRALDASTAATENFRQSLDALPARIDTTIQWLSKSVATQSPARAGDFEVFSRNLVGLREQARRLGVEADKAEAATANYFREWVREFNRTAPSGRAGMDEALAAKRENFDDALRLLRNGRTQFARLVTTLDGIQTSLNANLNDTTAAAAQPRVSTAVVQANEVRNYIAALTGAIDASLARR